MPVRVDGTNIVGTVLSTTIGENGYKVQTVEHLLAALSALGITNLMIELDSAELPIMDGSAMPFVDLIRKAGIHEQGEPQPVLKILQPIEVGEGDRRIVLRPSPVFRVNCTIRFDHPLVSQQRYLYTASAESFVREIAPARTFGFLDEVEALRRQGLARGGSLENAVVIGPEGILNEQGLRYPDEFVRHKVLDILGDMALLGMPTLGEVEADCPGHQINSRLVAKILASRESWIILGDRRPSSIPTALSHIAASI